MTFLLRDLRYSFLILHDSSNFYGHITKITISLMQDENKFYAIKMITPIILKSLKESNDKCTLLFTHSQYHQFKEVKKNWLTLY